jgi:DNA-binding protein YbaB
MDRAAAEYDARAGEYARIADQVRSMRAGVDDIRETAYSDDGLVTAVVGGRGEVVGLELDPRVYRNQDPEELASTIVATIHAAAEEASQSAVRYAEKLLPAHRGGEVDPMFDPVLHMLEDRS